MPFLPDRYHTRFCNGGLITSENELKFIQEKYFPMSDSYYSQIPCGQCLGCRLDYSRQWALRCMLEAKYHDHNVFVTLTYDDLHLPKTLVADNRTGELVESPYLYKRHIQLFMKRLRIYFQRHFHGTGTEPDKICNFHSTTPDIRCYYCGEYGSLNGRPHFHLILFNCELPDLVFLKKNFDGSSLYTSKIISDCWDNKGFITVGAVTFESCAYVARYMLKKQKGQSLKDERELLSHYDFEVRDFVPGLSSEFVGMSRNPGIARRYFDEHSTDIYSVDKVYCASKSGVLEVKPPSYFDNLFRLNHEEEYEVIKKKRKNAAKASNLALQGKIDIPLTDYSTIKENALKRKLKALARLL